MSGLGFRYITNLVWTKRHAGLGQYFRGRHELLLFGVRGKGQAEDVMTDDRTITTGALFDADRPMENGKRIHSAKPEAAHALVEARTTGPYLELFARRKRPGWTCWGDEITP